MPELARKVAGVFRAEEMPAQQDPDFMIYSGGFFSDTDKDLMAIVRASDASELARLDLPFKDGRLKELLFRYRARNYPETLRQEEQERWHKFRQSRLEDSTARQVFEEELTIAKEQAGGPKQSVLEDLLSYVDGL
jgi:exodeoxyribonuclease-1